MSIFQKDCPECTAPNPVDAVSCRCGYCFDPDTLARVAPDEYARQQDRLYRDYLAARVAQAEAELIVARELAKSDPGNTFKASGALLAEQALNALQAEMRQVNLRIGAAPRPAPPAARPRPAVKPVPPAPPKPAATSTAATSRPAPAPGALKPAAGKAATAAKAPAARRATAAAVPRAPQPAATPVPKLSAKPDERFKRVQAQRAEAIARASTVPAKPRNAPRLPLPAPFAPQPIARAPADIPPISLAPAPMQECPNCTASVPPDRQRCGCGYTFSRAAEEVPAITLDAAALAILTEGLSAIKRRTPGR